MLDLDKETNVGEEMNMEGMVELLITCVTGFVLPTKVTLVAQKS